jgi:hypothetical protein
MSWSGASRLVLLVDWGLGLVTLMPTDARHSISSRCVVEDVASIGISGRSLVLCFYSSEFMGRHFNSTRIGTEALQATCLLPFTSSNRSLDLTRIS